MTRDQLAQLLSNRITEIEDLAWIADSLGDKLKTEASRLRTILRELRESDCCGGVIVEAPSAKPGALPGTTAGSSKGSDAQR